MATLDDLRPRRQAVHLADVVDGSALGESLGDVSYGGYLAA